MCWKVNDQLGASRPHSCWYWAWSGLQPTSGDAVVVRLPNRAVELRPRAGLLAHGTDRALTCRDAYSSVLGVKRLTACTN